MGDLMRRPGRYSLHAELWNDSEHLMNRTWEENWIKENSTESNQDKKGEVHKFPRRIQEKELAVLTGRETVKPSAGANLITS